MARFAVAVLLALGMGAGLLAAGSASALTLLWDNAAGGDFQTAANWSLIPPPGNGVPTAVDDFAIANGPGDAPLTGSITLSADVESNAARVSSGQSTVDLVGNDLTLGQSLTVAPLVAGDTPVVTLTTTAGSSDVSVGTTVQVVDGGVLQLEGSGLSVEAIVSSVGVSADPAVATGSPSSAIVDAAAWTSKNRLDVGASGDGSLTIQNGGTVFAEGVIDGVQSEGVSIGADEDATGDVTVTGPGSLLQSNRIIVGGDGVGSLVVADGASVVQNKRNSDQGLFVGGARDAAAIEQTGSVLVTGAGSTLSVTGTTRLGNSLAKGTLRVEDGGEITLGRLTANQPSQAKIEIDGGTLTLNEFARVRVGSGGTSVDGSATHAGVLNLNGGAEFQTDLHAGDHGAININSEVWTRSLTADALGTVNFETGSLTLATQDLAVADGELLGGNILLEGDVTLVPEVVDPETGVVTTPAVIENRRNTLRVGGTLDIGLDQALPDAPVAGTITVKSGGSLEAERIHVGSLGSFDYQGGELVLSGSEVGDGLVVGSGQLLGGDVTLAAGDRVSVATSTTIETGSFLRLQGGELSTDTIDFDGTPAGLDWTSGTLTLTPEETVIGGASLLPGTLVAGQTLHVEQASVEGGAFTLNGGAIEADGIAVDNLAGDEFHYAAGVVRVGEFNHGVGESSRPTAKKDLDLGGDDGIRGAAGSTDFEIAAGDSVEATGTVRLDSTSTLALSGGMLRVRDLDVIGNNNTFTYTGGDLVLEAQDLLIGSSYASDNTKRLVLTSNTTFDPNAQTNVDPFFRLSDGMNVTVAPNHVTHVDSSQLEIGTGASLSTGSITGENNVIIDGGQLKLTKVTPSSYVPGDIVGAIINVSSSVALDNSGRLIGDAILGASGLLTGNGTVIGGLINGGVVNPGNSPGELDVQGFYDQLGTGTLVMEVGREQATQDIVHDALSVSGVAALDGTLDIQVDTSSPGLENPFTPSLGLALTFLTAGSVDGEFSDVLGRDAGGGLGWQLVYEDTAVGLKLIQLGVGGVAGIQDLDLRIAGGTSVATTTSAAAIVPEPATALMVGAGLVGLSWRGRERTRRRRRMTLAHTG